MPVRRARASNAAKKSFEVMGRDFRYSCKGEWVASRMAHFIVAIVTVPFLAIFLGSSSAPRIVGRPRDLLLGVLSKGLWFLVVRESSASTSAISTARRQISRARRASPDTAATFREANCIASASTMLLGTCSSRD